MNKENIRPFSGSDDDDIDIDAIFDKLDPDKIKAEEDDEEMIFDFSDIWEEFEKEEKENILDRLLSLFDSW